MVGSEVGRRFDVNGIALVSGFASPVFPFVQVFRLVPPVCEFVPIKSSLFVIVHEFCE